jgi:LCP family protein required for cell wall assembly
VIIAASVIVAFSLLLGTSGYLYARYRYDQIPKVKISALAARTKPGAPFNMLLVGSDSRQFVEGSGQAGAFGSASTVTGQRSDVIIVARVVPATHEILMLSIPRDTWVDIPGDVPDISGMNRVNAAYNSGPELLVQTIEKDFGIPINHYMEVGFEGFSNIVNALGGVYLDFSTPVKDTMSGLNIKTTGCQVVLGTQALALVRSRHLEYETTSGWAYDGMSDWSRIRRQEAFFRAVIAQVDSDYADPFKLNSFIASAVKDVTIDSTMSLSGLFSLESEFHSLSQKQLTTDVLPTTPTVLNGNDVLLPAQPYDSQMVKQFLAFGSSPPKPGAATTTTTAPSITPAQVSVEVLNGNGVAGSAGSAATQLQTLGYKIAGTTDAAQYTYTANEIEYPPSQVAAARLLESDLAGGATLVPDSSLSGSSITLIIGSAYDGVTSSSSTGTPTTTTTPSGNVVFDNPATLPEPWNPTPCNP